MLFAGDIPHISSATFTTWQQFILYLLLQGPRLECLSEQNPLERSKEGRVCFDPIISQRLVQLYGSQIADLSVEPDVAEAPPLRCVKQ